MRFFRTLLALAVLAAGVVPTGLLYAYSEDGNVGNLALWGRLSLFASGAAGAFLIARSIWPRKLRAFLVGALLSYSLWLFLLLAADGGDALMWLPVIVVVGIPFTASILAGAWLAAGVLLSLSAKPNNVLQPTREDARG